MEALGTPHTLCSGGSVHEVTFTACDAHAADAARACVVRAGDSMLRMKGGHGHDGGACARVLGREAGAFAPHATRDREDARDSRGLRRDSGCSRDHSIIVNLGRSLIFFFFFFF